VRCSLLTLSLFIDGELPAERLAEVDAHLVGCPRCGAGAAALREEKARVGRLARVHVDEASAPAMLEQVGISAHGVAAAVPAAPPPAPLQRRSSNAALPWIPRRPTPTPAAIEEVTVPPTPDVQPDLPFDAARAGRHPGQPVTAGGDAAASPEVEASSQNPEERHAVSPKGWAEADTGRLDQAPGESWEAELPPPLDAGRGERANWESPLWPAAASPPPPSPPPAPMPPSGAPIPARMAPGSGPAAAWGRVRDAVAVRVALARSPEAREDGVQIPGATTAPPVDRSPQPLVAVPPRVRAAAKSAVGAVAARRRRATEASPQAEVELQGARAAAIRPDPAISARSGAAVAGEERIVERSGSRPPRRRARPETREDAPEDGEDQVTPHGWNAFARSSYPLAPGEPTPERAQTPRPGRHSRALARERERLGARVGAVIAPAATALRVRTRTGAHSARTAGATGAPDRRVIAAVAGIVVVFVAALLIGRGPSRSSAPTAARPASSAAVQPRPAVPAQPTAAASSSQPATPATAPPAATTAPVSAAAPVTPALQTFGQGATGFEVTGVRYGAQASFERLVFDLGGAGAGSVPAGTPKVTVALVDATTVAVTIYGTLPAPVVASPPRGLVVSSVTAGASTAQITQYRLALTRPGTTAAFFLLSPTRFVLDVH